MRARQSPAQIDAQSVHQIKKLKDGAPPNHWIRAAVLIQQRTTPRNTVSLVKANNINRSRKGYRMQNIWISLAQCYSELSPLSCCHCNCRHHRHHERNVRPLAAAAAAAATADKWAHSSESSSLQLAPPPPPPPPPLLIKNAPYLSSHSRVRKEWEGELLFFPFFAAAATVEGDLCTHLAIESAEWKCSTFT